MWAQQICDLWSLTAPAHTRHYASTTQISILYKDQYLNAVLYVYARWGVSKICYHVLHLLGSWGFKNRWWVLLAGFPPNFTLPHMLKNISAIWTSYIWRFNHLLLSCLLPKLMICTSWQFTSIITTPSILLMNPYCLQLQKQCYMTSWALAFQCIVLVFWSQPVQQTTIFEQTILLPSPRN
jgi:hypothetical protein